MRLQRLPMIVLALLILKASLADAQQVRRPQSGPQHDGHQHGRTFEGREIADVMSYLGADWLLRPTRQREEQPEKMIEALEIAPGAVVADIGAGVGFHSLILARKVGPTGIVYATDVQPQMLAMLVERAEAAKVDNVVPVLCTQTYTGLPPESIDLALMVDVYHEASDPSGLLQGLRKALKPGGRLVLVEFRGEDPSVPINPDHKMTAAQVRKEVEPQGFQLQKRHDFLPWQHILIFEKNAEDQAEPSR
ncbi:class I SAM-dependent methyltransferase [soil metagenome]